MKSYALFSHTNGDGPHVTFIGSITKHEHNTMRFDHKLQLFSLIVGETEDNQPIVDCTYKVRINDTDFSVKHKNGSLFSAK